MKNKKALTIFIIGISALLAASAIIIGLRLRSNQPTTPNPSDASPAACCSVPGSGASCDAGATSCQGGDPVSACAAGNWCWCAQISNQCPQDPSHSSEIMCGGSAYDGSGVTYTCPDGSQATSSASVTDCGRCGGGETPVPPSCPEAPKLQHSLDNGATWQGGNFTISDPDMKILFRMDNSKRYVIDVKRQNGNNTCSFPDEVGGVVGSICPLSTSYKLNNPIEKVTGVLYENASTNYRDCAQTVLVTLSEITPTPTNTPTPTPTGTLTPTPTPITEVSVDKTASSTCNATSTISAITYTVTVVNNGDSTIAGLEVVDKLDSKIVQYIDQTSITDGGVFDATLGNIIWRNLTLGAGETKIYIYKANVPSSLFGTELTNTVTVNQFTGPTPGQNVKLAEKTMRITASCKVLPNTALISDSVDRVMLGLLLIIIGVLAYRLDLQEKIWSLFKKSGGKYLLASFDEEEMKKITDDKKDKLEKNIKKKLD